VPQDISSNVFYNINVGNVALQVPVASLAAYQSAVVWKDFYTIIGGATLRARINNSAWGSIAGTANGWLPANATVSLTATPAQGYEFESWTSGSATLGTSASLSISLTQDTVIAANFKPSGDVIVYTVSFDANGGSSVDPIAVASGSLVAKPADPTRSGYSFAGWYTDAAGTAAWSFETDKVTASATLHARWTQITYTVAFDANGGSSVSSQTVTPGDTATKPANPTRSGYTFDGWYSDADFTIPWNFNSGVTGNMTLYAKWSDPASTGVKSQTLGVARVYPNPTLGMVTIESNGEEALLYSLSGVLLKRTHSNRLNLSGYPSGVYLLKVGHKSAKIVKR
jgi:uncharacterized repeat protein (TIGR02543 family)